MGWERSAPITPVVFNVVYIIIMLYGWRSVVHFGSERSLEMKFMDGTGNGTGKELPMLRDDLEFITK